MGKLRERKRERERERELSQNPETGVNQYAQSVEALSLMPFCKSFYTISLLQAGIHHVPRSMHHREALQG
jgi:hypothetical protein